MTPERMAAWSDLLDVFRALEADDEVAAEVAVSTMAYPSLTAVLAIGWLVEESRRAQRDILGAGQQQAGP